MTAVNRRHSRPTNCLSNIRHRCVRQAKLRSREAHRHVGARAAAWVGLLPRNRILQSPLGRTCETGRVRTGSGGSSGCGLLASPHSPSPLSTCAWHPSTATTVWHCASPRVANRTQSAALAEGAHLLFLRVIGGPQRHPCPPHSATAPACPVFPHCPQAPHCPVPPHCPLPQGCPPAPPSS